MVMNALIIKINACIWGLYGGFIMMPVLWLPHEELFEPFTNEARL